MRIWRIVATVGLASLRAQNKSVLLVIFSVYHDMFMYFINVRTVHSSKFSF